MAVWGLTASTSRGLRHHAVNHIMCSGFTADALSTLTRRIWRHELHPINNAVLAGTALGPDIIVSHEIEGMYVCANLLQNMWHSGISVRLAIGKSSRSAVSVAVEVVNMAAAATARGKNYSH